MANTNQRNSSGITVLATAVGILALGPLGALACYGLGRAADKWVDDNRDKYER